MNLTPDILAASYEALRVCAPFVRWGLPAHSHLKFQVTRHKDREGHYTRYIGTSEHFICVSSARIAHYHSLSEVMAHEMIHLVQAVKKLESKGEHNADFKKRAGVVCRTLGFDPHLFCPP